MSKEKMKQLVTELNEASKAYYNGDETMTNYEWDKKLDELKQLEKEAGIALPDSPTRTVGAEPEDKLQKVKHEFPALSLDKTKDVEKIAKKMQEGAAISKLDAENETTVMWKMDGGTVVLTYDNGNLTLLTTRGNGEIGSDVTFQAKNIHGIPETIPFLGHAVFRGEVVMSYTDFNRINENLEPDDQYENPRNLATATLRLTDEDIVKSRNLAFMGFALVNLSEKEGMQGLSQLNRNLSVFSERLKLMKKWGFNVVHYKTCKASELTEVLDSDEFNPAAFDYPVDGLVVALEDYELASVQPSTGHNPHVWNGYALKWQDETKETTVRDIVWSAGRTGVFTPVVVFDPVRLEGTTVTKASMHNLGLLAVKDIKIGDRITVYKSNKIIPQVDRNLDACKISLFEMSDTELHARYNVPIKCPACGALPAVKDGERAIMLECPNPMCGCKQTGNIVHFCGREHMDIQGMSDATVEFLIHHGFIKNVYGLYELAEKYEQTGKIENADAENIMDFDGWAETSVKNMVNSINHSKNTTFVRFLSALSIPGIGRGQAKLLAPAIIAWEKEAGTVNDPASLFVSLCKMVGAGYDFTSINGIGDVLSKHLVTYMQAMFIEPYRIGRKTPEMKVLERLTFTDTKEDYVKSFTGSSISGKTFVITGSVNHYANRNALKAEIESLGGKVSGSVSKNTDYLINNNTESTSGKNKKAQELNIPIISEDTYRKLAGV